jgi:hypothetical protein
MPIGRARNRETADFVPTQYPSIGGCLMGSLCQELRASFEGRLQSRIALPPLGLRDLPSPANGSSVSKPFP